MAQNAVHTPRLIRKGVFDAPKLVLGMVWPFQQPPNSKPGNPLFGSRERAKRPMNPLRGLRVSKRPPCDAVRIWKVPGEPPAVSNFCGSTLGARALLQSLPDHRSARASQAFPSSCSSRYLSRIACPSRCGVRGLARCGPFVCAEGCVLKELRVWLKKQTH